MVVILSDDVLYQIFGGTGRHIWQNTATMCSLALVCRRFTVSRESQSGQTCCSRMHQVIADKVMLNSAWIYSSFQLQRFADRLDQRLAPCGRPAPAGALVRSFHIKSRIGDTQSINDVLSMQSLLTSIFGELSGLKAYICPYNNVPMTRSLMSSIAAKCARSLTYLCFSMTRSSSWTAGISTHLNRLTSLENLEIMIHIVDSKLHSIPQSEVALAIPTVTAFTLCVRYCGDRTDGLSSYHAQCRLHPTASFFMHLGAKRL
jgi:hypothetical protein